MNQYRCETCKNPNCPAWIGANLRLAQTGKMRDHHICTVIERTGCTHHSDFKSDTDLLKEKYRQLMAASINNENPGWVQIAEIEKILKPFDSITPDIENLQEFPFRSSPKKVGKRLRHDCYNCGTFCDYLMAQGTGVTTKDAVEYRRKIHNGEKCYRWSEPYAKQVGEQ